MSLQTLGGTRQSSPLDDEMTYPLTEDEFFLLKENLKADKLTNVESFLVSTASTTFVSTIVLCLTSSFEKVAADKTVHPDISQYVIVCIYGAVFLGSLIGFLLARKGKKTSDKALSRLQTRIEQHLAKTKS